MDVDSFALEHMYEQNYDFEETDVRLINIGASIANINVVLNAVPSSRDFSQAAMRHRGLQEKLGVTREAGRSSGVRGGE